MITKYLLRFFDCLVHANLSATIVLISEISTMVNGTLLNFSKIYEDNLRIIFDQRPKLHLGLDALINQKILKGI